MALSEEAADEIVCGLFYKREIFRMLKAFLKDDHGATAIEYGLIAAMIAITIVTIFSPFSSAITGLYDKITASFEGVE